MSSPFVGMDPYLEDPRFWPDVHSSLIYCLRAALNQSLPEAFSAGIEERLYISEWDRQVVADAVVTQPKPVAFSGGSAVLDAPIASPFHALRVYEEPIRETFVEIRARGASGRVVTILEVLSLANKEDRRGREAYLRKQQDVLDSEINLVEIDLLRAGRYTLAAPLSHFERTFTAWDYAICLHRARTDASYRDFVVGAWKLGEPLPALPVPLADGYPDLSIDLGAVLARVYEEGNFERRIDYAAPMP
jgi:hypothetical protein